MKKFKRTVPIINIPCMITVYDEPLELLKAFNDLRFYHDVRDFQGGVFETSGTVHIALLNDKYLRVGHIAHECKHAVNLSFKLIGQELDRDNDELECYFLSYFVDEVHKCLDNYNT